MRVVGVHPADQLITTMQSMNAWHLTYAILINMSAYLSFVFEILHRLIFEILCGSNLIGYQKMAPQKSMEPTSFWLAAVRRSERAEFPDTQCWINRVNIWVKKQQSKNKNLKNKSEAAAKVKRQTLRTSRNCEAETVKNYWSRVLYRILSAWKERYPGCIFCISMMYSPITHKVCECSIKLDLLL